MTFNRVINYISFVLLVLIIGTQAYNLYYTRNDSFPGVWIVRSTIVVVIAAFLNYFIFSAFLHRFTMDQLPSCTSVAYFQFRWYVFLMAALSLSAIPIYFAVLQRTVQNRLLRLLASQIQINLVAVLLYVAMDALSRYMYQKQVSAANGAQTQPPQMQQSNSNNNDVQFGYFSPKSKGPAPLTSQKNPFESSKFRYAR